MPSRTRAPSLSMEPITAFANPKAVVEVPYRNATSANEYPPSERTCENISAITTKSNAVTRKLPVSIIKNDAR